MTLTKHFKLDEFVKSETANKNNIDNTPSKDVQGNLLFLATYTMEPIRRAWGEIKINSGYRCDALNKLVGGSPTSYHRYGLACDFAPKHKEIMKSVFNWCIRSLDYDKLIWEFDSWIHIQVNTNARKNRSHILEAFKSTNEIIYARINRI